MKKNKLLIISQVFVPDPAAVGQYMSDVAAEMVKRGWEVVVFTANRGYDDPSLKYDRRELIGGAQVKRFPLSSLGKGSLAVRLLAAMLFMLQTVIHGLVIRDLASILVSTSPPMASLAGVIISMVRKTPIKYWVMDLNPDQAIEMGIIAQDSIAAKLFNQINSLILKQADQIIVLDHFMVERLNKKAGVNEKIIVIPPWPLGDYGEEIVDTENPFRLRHGLSNKFIFMYSGNHSLANPVKTILEAALLMQDYSSVVFMFIGGGNNKREIDNAIKLRQPGNIMSLPYQPFNETRYSLSAADVHIVSIGENMSGIVHPSKIYGSMAVGRPILLLGPANSYAGEIVKEYNIGWQIDHGDVDSALDIMKYIITMPKEKHNEMGNRARKLAEKQYSRSVLLKEFCDIIDE